MNARLAQSALAALVAVSLVLHAPALAQDPEPAPPKPAGNPVVPPATAAAPAQETKPAGPVERTDLPAARSILDKSIAAMGGEKAFDAIKTSMVKATMSTPMGDLALDMNWMKPNKVFIQQAMPGMESTMGSDGTVSWVKSPAGYQILEPDQAKQMQEQANMFRMVTRMRDEAKELKTVDKQMFSERETYKVSAVDNEGNEQFAFFDVEDHLIRGIEATQETQMGPVTSTIRFSEWKEDGGLKYFTKIDIEQMGMAMALTFNEVKFNTLDESAFALPEEVKAMLKAREGAASQPAQSAPAKPDAGGGGGGN